MCQMCAIVPPKAACNFDAQPTIVMATITEGNDAASVAPNTTYTLQVGDVFSGTIGSAGDYDVVALQVTAGQMYSVDLTGLNIDGYIALYDTSGSYLRFADSGAVGVSEQLVFLADTTGTYFVIVSDYTDALTGSYSLEFTEFDNNSLPPVGTLDDLANYLTDGYWLDGGEPPHQFDTTGSNIITYNINALTAAGKQLALWAMDAWEMVADIVFVADANGGAAPDIVFDDNQDGRLCRIRLYKRDHRSKPDQRRYRLVDR